MYLYQFVQAPKYNTYVNVQPLPKDLTPAIPGVWGLWHARCLEKYSEHSGTKTHSITSCIARAGGVCCDCLLASAQGCNCQEFSAYFSKMLHVSWTRVRCLTLSSYKHVLYLYHASAGYIVLVLFVSLKTTRFVFVEQGISDCLHSLPIDLKFTSHSLFTNKFQSGSFLTRQDC